MNLLTTPIKGAMVAETSRFIDKRGVFARLFCERELATVLGGHHIMQMNHSLTGKEGTIRGMHFQHPPHAEMKLVRCLKGKVWDVAVDLRNGSPTFLHWYARELSPKNMLMMIIPEGCAHGFQVLEADSELLYLSTAFYSPESEGGVAHDDPAIGIKWPRDVSDLSDRDRAHPLIDEHCPLLGSNFPRVTL